MSEAKSDVKRAKTLPKDSNHQQNGIIMMPKVDAPIHIYKNEAIYYQNKKLTNDTFISRLHVILRRFGYYFGISRLF